jgi:SAM-dependent methyltransferase
MDVFLPATLYNPPRMVGAERSTAAAAETAKEAEAVRRYFDGFLAACIRFVDASANCARRRTRSRRAVASRHAVVASLLERHAIYGKRVVDLGCGTGETSIAAGRLGARVVGIDLVERVIAAATRKAAAAGLAPRVQFRLGDVTSMPLDRSDVTLLVGVIEYYSDLEGLLGRVCAATGELSIVVDTRGPWRRRALRRLVRRVERFTLVYRSPDQVARVMRACGFDETDRIEGHSFVAMAFRRAEGVR